jgi:Zn-dependent protease
MSLYHGQLACPNCGALVFARELNNLAAAAQKEEAISPVRAAMMWQQALPLLPPDSQQHRSVLQRVGMLTAGLTPPALGQETPAKAPPRNDPLPLALTKTIGSMLISILVYTILFTGSRGIDFGLKFAVGFVLLMLIHELGHSFAMRYYGLSASPPIFIPFLGAVINLRQMPRNALEEAIVGIGGPVTGTIAAIVTYLIYLKTGSSLFLMLAEFGFMLNLFNMLPVPPLDGGRVTAAVSPWLWMPGLLGVAVWIAHDFFRYGHFNFILVLLILMAWRRVSGVLSGKVPRGEYYNIGRTARIIMGSAYLGLGLFLAVMYALTRLEAARFGPGLFG